MTASLRIALTLFAALAVVALVFIAFSLTSLTGCSGSQKPEDDQDGGRLDFTRLTLNLFGSMASMDEYELVRTGSGVVCSHYRGWWEIDGDGDGVKREDCLISRVEGDAALYDELAAEFGRLGVNKWNGFSKSDPRVLDGGGFRLEIELGDGESIGARGTNAYPRNYHELRRLIEALFERERGAS